MWVGWSRRRKPPHGRGHGSRRQPTVAPHPFALPIASLPEAQALSRRERDQSSLAIPLNASSNTPAGCPPEISHFPSTTTAGTPLIPRICSPSPRRGRGRGMG